MEEVIRLEAAGTEVERLMFDLVQKESESIVSLLAECLCRYEKEIVSLKYDLSKEEVKRVGGKYRETPVITMKTDLF